MLEKIRNKPAIFLLIILIGFFIFTLFYHINHVFLSNWDESRHGVSALEMIHSHNYLINTWAGKADMWNVKPILSFLPTCFSFLLLGKSILALRFFSIISAILLCLTVCFYCYKKYNIFTSLLFLSLLFTASLIIRNHAFRTGDADSFFILCQTLAVLTISDKNDTKHLTLATFLSALAFLSKSFHAFFMGLSYIIAYSYLLKNKQLTISSFLFPILAFFLPILTWATLRYSYDGFAFFKEMYEYDLITRSTHLIVNHYHGHAYYFKQLFRHFNIITVVFLFSLLYSFIIRKRKAFTYDIIILLSTIFSSLIIFTLATTKLHHYQYTQVILMCITSAILISRDMNRLVKLLIYCFAIFAIFYNFHTLKILRKITVPSYYAALKTHAFPEYQAIYIPSEISQAKRMAFMIFGNFNAENIQQGNPVLRPSLIFYQVGEKDNPDITGCQQISTDTNRVEYKDWDETVQLYACKAK